ncbi:MAG: FecR domain-containing protein [Flavobacteriaceae bacterium]|nr:FecR domain-containing protein [Flavobacteriaceae bacterium]
MKEHLIQKWLDGELNDAELQAFKELPEYESYTKLSETAKLFKDTSYNVELELEKLNSIIKDRKQPEQQPVKVVQMQWIKPLLRVAAIFIIGLAVYYSPIYGDSTTVVKTLASNTTTIELPDNSEVKLNAASSIKYSKKKWKKNREVNLVGEAYFKVEKGSQFDVVTWLGKVSVLGTQFNVKQRVNYFEVICYEGLVSVSYKGKDIKLPAGKSFKIIDGKIVEGQTKDSVPSWAQKSISSFKSVPYGEVIKEFERQYNVVIEAKNIDTTQLFTGSFTNKDKELALKSITLPLQLKYIKKDSAKIVLTKE